MFLASTGGLTYRYMKTCKVFLKVLAGERGKWIYFRKFADFHFCHSKIRLPSPIRAGSVYASSCIVDMIRYLINLVITDKVFTHLTVPTADKLNSTHLPIATHTGGDWKSCFLTSLRVEDSPIFTKARIFVESPTHPTL